MTVLDLILLAVSLLIVFSAKRKMKKTITILTVLILSSCSYNPKPIEKYRGKGYVITRIGTNFSGYKVLELKNPDSIISATVLPFDVLTLKVGDSLK